MIKKFKEFIEEGFMTRSLNRDRSTSLRKEDEAFFKNEDFRQLEKFEEWYLKDEPEENMCYLYHYPNKNWIMKFFDVYRKGYDIGYMNHEFSDDATNDEIKLLMSDDFVNDVYNTCSIS